MPSFIPTALHVIYAHNKRVTAHFLHDPVWAASDWPSGDRKLLNILHLSQLKLGAMQHEEAGDDLDGPSPKKQRHVWTSEAHHKFMSIVEGLGDSKQACPSSPAFG